MNEEDDVVFLDGWFAHKTGVPGEENPHNERTQSVSYARWDRGWGARFNACKHDLPLTYDTVSIW